MSVFRLKTLLKSFIITVIFAVIGGLFSIGASAVYDSLKLPPLAPPSALFGWVWPILYLLMALAFNLILQLRPSNEREEAAKCYLVQLVVNAAWPLFFFRLKFFWIAAVIDAALVAMVFLTIKRFRALNQLAGNLLIPYLLWILFALYLNIGVTILN